MPCLLTFAVLVAFVATSLSAAPANANLQQVLKQKLAEQAISTVLNNQLPLKLDAKALYSTVVTPRGGSFEPWPLHLPLKLVFTPAKVTSSPLPKTSSVDRLRLDDSL